MAVRSESGYETGSDLYFESFNDRFYESLKDILYFHRIVKLCTPPEESLKDIKP